MFLCLRRKLQERYICQFLTGFLFVYLTFHIYANQQKIRHDETHNPYALIKESSWDFYSTGLYLKPQNINNITTSISEDPSVNLPTQFEWGFNLKGRYFFDGGRDTKIIWVHFKDEKDETLLEPKQIRSNDPTLNSQGGLVPYAYTSQFDILEFEYGQNIDLFNRLHMRIHGGLEYANIRSDYRYTVDITNNNTRTQDSESNQYSYYVVGPRIGLQFDYSVFDSWDIVVEGSASVLQQIGQYDITINLLVTNGGATQLQRTLTTQNDLEGPLVGIEMLFGISHELTSLSHHLSFTGGYTSYIFTESWASWGGGYIGAKWRSLN